LDILNNELDERIWRLRQQCHWTIPRIARWVGLSNSTVHRRLTDLERRHGIRRPRKVPRRRKVRLTSLSTVFNA
jgi:DNA-binding Lrp family transcriptional regulator